METNELQAGRELDALIAEKVMGWTIASAKWHPDWPKVQVGALREGGAGCRVPDKARDYSCTHGDFPPFSTDIAAAWQVVEKLRADGVFANIGPDPSVGGGWNAQFYWDGEPDEFDNTIHQVDAEAPTAPLAICRAALKAVSK